MDHAEGALLRAELRSQLDDLRQLNAWWFDERDGLGEPISPALIEHVRDVIELAVEQEQLALPYIYPTVEGGILADWEIGVWRLDCEWTAVGEAYIHAFDVSCDESKVWELRGASAGEVAAQIIRASSSQ
jgi:hypothetical protein